MKRLVLSAAALFVLGAQPAQLGAPQHEFALSGILTEISGLAPASPHTVFAHNDEFAIVHELDVRTGAVLRSFALGKPTVPGDFEGIAAAGSFVYLVTSKGLLYEAHPELHGKRVAYNVYDTQLGKVCEIEGLANAEHAGEFYLLCKRTKGDKDNKRLVIYKWTFAGRLKELQPAIDVAISSVAPLHANFKASDLERDPKTGNLLLTDAGAAAVVEITAKGAPVGYWRMKEGRHPQAEGLAVMPDGAIVVGDEGVANEGYLTVYPPRR